MTQEELIKKSLHNAGMINHALLRNYFDIPVEEFTHDGKGIVLMTVANFRLIDVNSAMASLAEFGGAAAIRTTEEVFDDSIRYIVLIDDAYISSMDKDIMISLIYHELGHIHAGYLDGDKSAIGTDGFIKEGKTQEELLEGEVIADRYSVDHGFGIHLINYLQLVLNNDKVQHLINVPLFQNRIVAINAAIGTLEK